MNKNLMLNKSTVIFDEHEHTYNNGEYTGVTTLLTQVGVKAEMPKIPSVMQAAKRGTEIHFQFKAWLDLGLLPTHEWLKKAQEMYVKPDAYNSEYLVSNNKYKIATEIDIVELRDGELYICDLKSSRNIDKDSCIWQLSIGRWLFAQQNKELSLPISNTGIIYHVREDKFEELKYELKDFETVELLLKTWEEGKLWNTATDKPIGDLSNINEEDLIKRMEIILREIDALEKKVEVYKDVIKEKMRENSIKNIDRKTILISYSKATETKKLNKKKLFEDHPEINEDDYTTISPRKDSIKITLK